MTSQDLVCAACGFSLGLGTAGAAHWCTRCAGYVVADLRRGDAAGAGWALLAVGIAFVIALVLLMVFARRA